MIGKFINLTKDSKLELSESLQIPSGINKKKKLQLSASEKNQRENTLLETIRAKNNGNSEEEFTLQGEGRESGKSLAPPKRHNISWALKDGHGFG